jgi:uncharacterized membrane protein
MRFSFLALALSATAALAAPIVSSGPSQDLPATVSINFYQEDYQVRVSGVNGTTTIHADEFIADNIITDIPSDKAQAVGTSTLEPNILLEMD